MLQFYFGIFIASLMTLLGAMLFGLLNQRFPKSVDFLQGLSAGMLLSVVFFGIIPESTETLKTTFSGIYIGVFLLSLGAGALLLPGFEKILPVQHHHEFEEKHLEQSSKSLAFVLLGAFGIHSVFELVAILVTGGSNPILGWALILIIGIHNIPIGFIIYAQLESFGYTVKNILLMLLGLIITECVIAWLIYLILLPFIGGELIGILLGITAGVMLYLNFDELLPQIYKAENQHSVNACIIIGIMTMYFVISLGGH